MSTISKAEAEALFADLNNALADLNKAVLAIAETKAWVVLGYVSLGEAVGDRVMDLRLGPRAALVRMLVSHNVPGTEVLTIKGVTPVTVLEAMREVGKAPAAKPKGEASVPSRPYRIAFEVDPDERDHWVESARASGTSVRDVVMRAARKEFASLESHVRRTA